MFIVVPYLTSVKDIYGIYAVCISVTIFLSYADLGFISAGQKYAAEYFIKSERQDEIRMIGFSGFILAAFLAIFSIVFLWLGFNPELLISGLRNDEQKEVASSLLFILAAFTPVTLLQRFAQMIFGIRLEDYIIQRINVIASICKIASVPFFLGAQHYNIVGYYLFSQVVALIAICVVLLIATKRYNYEFALLFRSIRFNGKLYFKTRGLAFASLYLTLMWILYYELDSIVIAKISGAEKVAIYAIGLTIMSFFRTIYAVIFAPFGARFNHFVGLNDDKGLIEMHNKITSLFAPVVIIPVLTVCFMAKPLIINWVGSQYTESVRISQWLILCFIYGFITYPSSLLLIAKEKIKALYIINSLTSVVYWAGIAVSYSLLGLESFAVFKFVAFTLTGIATLLFIQHYLDLKTELIFNSFIKPSLLPAVFIALACFVSNIFLPLDKSKINLLSAAFSTGFIILIAFALLYFTSTPFKQGISDIIFKKNKANAVIR